MIPVSTIKLLCYFYTVHSCSFAGKVVRSPFGVVHGKSSPVYYDEKLDDHLFSGLPK